MTIDEAYRHCRAIAHKHGANFSVGFRFLPRAKRRAVYAAYAFCRVADDIADESLDDSATRRLDDFTREEQPRGVGRHDRRGDGQQHDPRQKCHVRRV